MQKLPVSTDALSYRCSPMGIHLHHISSTGSWIPNVSFLLQAVPQFAHCAATSAGCLLVHLVATGSPGIACVPGPAISAFRIPQHSSGLTVPSWPGSREKRWNIFLEEKKTYMSPNRIPRLVGKIVRVFLMALEQGKSKIVQRIGF